MEKENAEKNKFEEEMEKTLKTKKKNQKKIRKQRKLLIFYYRHTHLFIYSFIYLFFI
jgi:hypothetical protein